MEEYALLGPEFRALVGAKSDAAVYRAAVEALGCEFGVTVPEYEPTSAHRFPDPDDRPASSDCAPPPPPRKARSGDQGGSY
ncbi:hypothetical protein [Chondromyces apiculatus]|uniref:Uncharacterized protein n=1 Tax=Chondromyces apiculatus DSM 436 TaxID=1192034 RepID=A0A017TBN4_9BACT|nr:hypothetical protein [Chondromyces apiculatus]EYF06011.1 Hypothetical protein CAP_2471 [Chondromyces apiculatus DSM 436]